MNRSNVGNIVTNGMQILSVAGTTAAKIFNLGEAHKTLNNQDDNNVDKIMSGSGNNSKSTTNSRTTPKEKTPLETIAGVMAPGVTDMKAFADEADRRMLNKGKQKEDSLDDIVNNFYKPNSSQVKEIQTKLKNDNEFINSWKQVSNKDFIAKINKQDMGVK